MAQKFKVGDKVNHFSKGDGVVIKSIKDELTVYPVKVSFEKENYTFTSEGRLYEDEEISLRLTGRPFNVGDRVVIGGEKGVVLYTGKNTPENLPTTRLLIKGETLFITTDGRAWPGTPIICEHDWQIDGEAESEETETVNTETVLDDVTVSPAEVRHIAEMQEQVVVKAAFEVIKKSMEQDLMPKYVQMALWMAEIEVDVKTADLIREIVDSVNAHGGQYDIDTSCNIRQKIEEKYAV